MTRREIESSWARTRALLSEPRDGSSLAFFRICFGLLLAYEIDFKIHVNKVKELYQPQLNFKYVFFEWIPSPDKTAAYLLHFVLIGLGLCIAAGAFYRVTTWLTCLLFSYYFLCERTLYINHIYLYCLLLGIMACVPAHNMLSVDARYGWLGTRPKACGRVPLWSIWLLRFQMGVVYTYAGLAKLNPDWFQGSPLNLWLPSKLGHEHWLLFGDLPLWMSWGGAAFDLSVTPLLLFKRTRTVGFVWALAFHLTNATIFGIASFPWMSIALTLLFFEPDWPRRELGKLIAKSSKPRDPAPMTNPGLALLLGYVALQIFLPMRPWFYPGDSSWTEEGHEFSWHMMLRAKDVHATYHAEFPNGERLRIDPAKYLTPRQLARMGGRPDLVHQFAHFVANDYEREGKGRPKVFVEANVGFNGRPPQPLIDPGVDLAAEPRTLAHAAWLMPEPTGPPGRYDPDSDADGE